MENVLRAMALLAHCMMLTSALAAGAGNSPQQLAFAGLEEFRATYDAADPHRCSLGFLGAGSPFIITRVSDLFQESGVLESDQLVQLNDIEISDASDLYAALDDLDASDSVTLRLTRNEQAVRVHISCRDGTSFYRAREDALVRASEGRWQDCIRATYLEEIYWGGANSQSAALRLWCHRASKSSNIEDSGQHESLNKISAHFVFEYANHLINEFQHVPGGIDALRLTLYSSIRELDDGGYLLLSSELDAKLSAVERRLVARR